MQAQYVVAIDQQLSDEREIFKNVSPNCWYTAYTVQEASQYSILNTTHGHNKAATIDSMFKNIYIWVVSFLTFWLCSEG